MEQWHPGERGENKPVCLQLEEECSCQGTEKVLGCNKPLFPGTAVACARALWPEGL